MILFFLREKLNNKIIIIALVFFLLMGKILNFFSPHRLFCFNQIMLICMLIMQIIILNKIKMGKSDIKKSIMEKNEPDVIALFNTKVEKISHSFIGESISIVLVFVYILTMYEVGCLEYTYTGVYGGILGGLVFYVGIQAYIHYISLLFFAYDLRHVQIRDYSFYFPALTKWIRALAREFSFIEKWFLILGLMYSSIYAINLPKGTIIINDGLVLNSKCNGLLMLTWIGILLLFAVAFPVFTFLGRSYIKEVIYHCKCNSINQIEKQLSIISNQPTKEDLALIEKYIALTNMISQSDNYPLNYGRTIFNSIYTIVLSLVTLISPLLTFVEKIFLIE